MRRYYLTIISLFIVCYVSVAQSVNEQTFKFGQALGSIVNYYVDPVDQEKLVEHALIEMLKELDPHSVYINKDDVRAMNEPLEGNFEGIGVQFNILNDTIFIISPISGGPSERVGIVAGDRIVKIDDENVAGVGISNTQVRERLLGEKGTQVKVSIKRRNQPEDLDFTITRDKIPIYSLDASYMADEGIGYIRLNRFSATTVTEFEDALERLRKENNLEHLILDLRDNGGGYLQESISLADHFLDRGKMIVYTEGSNISQMEYRSSRNGQFIDGRLIVMLNEGSASASEIVAGAVQDWDRGVILGRRSFGKGLVQRPVNLPDGSMIRLTVARYFTPVGRLIQRPYDQGVDEYAMEALRRYSNGEFFYQDSIAMPDSLRYHTKINRRDVFGGGGIMPDIFVPLDTVAITDYYRRVVSSGILNRFILTYVDRNRDNLASEYPDFNLYKAGFVVDENIISELIDFASSEGLEPEEEDLQLSGEVLSNQIKALIARDMWNLSEYYEIANSLDNSYLKALNIIKYPDLYNRVLNP